MNTVLREAEAPTIEDRSVAAVSRLRGLADHPAHGILEWSRPVPSAAFSRKDVRLPGFADAVATAADHGFVPFIRPVGGHVVLYDESWLVLDLFVRSDDPRSGTTARFRTLGAVLAEGLTRLGVDARLGAVPGEYCPGQWSVNAGGCTKLIGTGQRLVRDSWLFTAVIAVQDPGVSREAMTDVYDTLDLPMDPATIGSLSQAVPGATHHDVIEVLGDALAEALPLGPASSAFEREVTSPWDPR